VTEFRHAWSKIPDSNLSRLSEIFLFVPVTKKRVWKVLIGFIWLREAVRGGLCGKQDKVSDFIKLREFVD
jgi:hypothetical protein